MTVGSRAVTEVLSVKYGERLARKSDLYVDYASYGLPDGDVEMDYNFWVIRAGETVVLVDTGYDVSKKEWLGEVSVTPTPEALSMLGIDPLAVAMVIVTHFHFDHIGYLHLFENAEFIAGRAEYDYWMGKRRAGTLAGEFVSEDDLAVIERIENEGRLTLIDATTEVYPGITAYPIGGHCPGELVVLASTEKNPVIIASDAAHLYDQLEHGWPFFSYTDMDAMRRGFTFLRELAAETDAELVPGHDAGVRSRYPAAPGPAGAVATVLG